MIGAMAGVYLLAKFDSDPRRESSWERLSTSNDNLRTPRTQGSNCGNARPIDFEIKVEYQSLKATHYKGHKIDGIRDYDGAGWPLDISHILCR